MSTNSTQSPRKDLWIPACFVAFFICLAGLEIWFVTMATQTFSGLVTDEAYAVGVNYNEVLKQREAERELGWTTIFEFVDGDGLDGELTLTIRDAAGQPLVADNLRATAERMSRHPQIQSVSFDHIGDGAYRAAISVPLGGRWFVRVRIEQGEQVFHAIEEVDFVP